MMLGWAPRVGWSRVVALAVAVVAATVTAAPAGASSPLIPCGPYCGELGPGQVITPTAGVCSTTNPNDVSEAISSSGWSLTAQLTCTQQQLLSAPAHLWLYGGPTVATLCQSGIALAGGTFGFGLTSLAFQALIVNTPDGALILGVTVGFLGQGTVLMSEDAVQRACTAPAGGFSVPTLVAAVYWQFESFVQT